MRKTRPVVIISDDEIGILPLKVVVPVTDWKDRYENVVWMTKVNPNRENNLTKISAVDAFQICCVSEQRFVERIGKLADEEIQNISESLKNVLKIE